MRLCYELGLEDFAAATIKDMVCLFLHVVWRVNGKKEKKEDVYCAVMQILM